MREWKEKKKENRKMTRKTYFGNTVESAMALARRELGEEVWLVSARPAEAEESAWGAYAVEAAAEMPAHAPASQPAAATTGVAGAESSVLAELSRMRGELSRLEQVIASNTMVAGAGRILASPWARQQLRLRAAGVPAELAAEWIIRAQERATLTADHRTAAEALRLVVLESLMVAGDSAAPQKRVLALVGPPGGGKTTLLVKLAWRLGLESGRTCAIISTDTQRIAAADQLRSYAGLIGVPFRVADSRWSFQGAMEEFTQTNLVLVDTPGFGARDTDALSVAAQTWPPDLDVETHLVLTAQASPADLWNAVVCYAPFRPRCLAFTRLDETTAAGGMTALAARARLPVSFLSFGQGVPEDFEPATAARLWEWTIGDVRLPGVDQAARGVAA